MAVIAPASAIPAAGVCSNPAKSGWCCLQRRPDLHDGPTSAPAASAVGGKRGVRRRASPARWTAARSNSAAAPSTPRLAPARPAPTATTTTRATASRLCNPQTLQCQAGTAVDCSAFERRLQRGRVQRGHAVAAWRAPRPTARLCDDGNLCTAGLELPGRRVQGLESSSCARPAISATTLAPATRATGQCSNPAKANGSTCNDGNACTQTDTCQGGACTGADAVVCAPVTSATPPARATPSSGICSNPAKTNGSACSDGSLCTQTDTCQGGLVRRRQPRDLRRERPVPRRRHAAIPARAPARSCQEGRLGSATDGDACTQTDTLPGWRCTGRRAQ